MEQLAATLIFHTEVCPAQRPGSRLLGPGCDILRSVVSAGRTLATPDMKGEGTLGLSINWGANSDSTFAAVVLRHRAG